MGSGSHDALVFAAAAASRDGGGWGLVVAIVTAVVAVVTLLLREVQRRKEDLDQKVAGAVNAGLGRTLLEFREMEESAKRALNAVLDNAERMERELKERLVTSETQSERLQELLARAAEVVPRLTESEAIVPALLLAQAEGDDPDTAMAAAVALLESEFVTSDVLTRTGDIAARRLMATSIALGLYDRAVKLNPNNADARASAIRLRTTIGQLSPEEGTRQIAEVAHRNPLDRSAVSEALDLFIHLDDYAGLLAFVEQQLESGHGSASLMWRNRAIAMRELRRPSAEVSEAFQRSFELALETGEAVEISNNARPYAAYLRRAGDLDRARGVVEVALRVEPREALLLLLMGEIESDSGNYESAAWCFETAARCATTPNEQRMAKRRIEDQRLRAELAERGVISAVARSERGRAGDDVAGMADAVG